MNRLTLVVFLLTCMAVISAVVTGVMLIDSPGEERLKRLDQTRIDTISAIVTSADCVYEVSGEYPGSLEALVEQLDSLGVSGCSPRMTRDPVTDEALTYRRLESGIQVCAVFDTAYDSQRDPVVARQLTSAERQRWHIRSSPSHDSGEQCFRFDPVSRDDAPG